MVIGAMTPFAPSAVCREGGRMWHTAALFGAREVSDKKTGPHLLPLGGFLADPWFAGHEPPGRSRGSFFAKGPEMTTILDPHAVHIYTDGTCFRNPGGESGYAAIVEYPENLQLPDEQILDFGCSESSNNRMELRACISALWWVRDNHPWDGVQRVQIATDSMYVKGNVPHATQWKQNKWCNRHGEPIENADLWNELLFARRKAGIRVDFEWVQGKKSPILRKVDAASKNAAKRGGLHADHGYKPGKIARSMVDGPAIRFPAQGQVIIIRIYRKTTPLKSKNKIRFDLFLEETQTYSGSYYAYASDAITAELHRQHGYRARVNDDALHPQIEEILDEVVLPRDSQLRERKPY